MNGRLEGKVALVTGGASGIGKATAERFAREGSRVLVSDVAEEAGERVAGEIGSTGGEAAFVRCDVSKPDEVDGMARRAVEAYGGLDCAFNNAGVEGSFAPTADYSPEAWRRVIEINLLGVFYCMRSEVPRLLERGGGAIVNMASILGTVGRGRLPIRRRERESHRAQTTVRRRGFGGARAHGRRLDPHGRLERPADRAHEQRERDRCSKPPGPTSARASGLHAGGPVSGSTKAITAAALLLASGSGATAQMGASHRPEDVATPEAIVAASYEAISRRPGEEFDWDRVISLFLPSARLIPNTEQTGGEFLAMSPQEFRRWVEESYAENAPIGGPDDRGFQEEQIHAVVERYGDIAHVLSTYRTRYWGAEEILGRGINSFQLVRHDGRWWIAGIVWDEEGGAGSIPTGYLPGTTERANDAGAAESEIADLIEEVEAANNAGDVERWVGLFAEGAVYMPPGAPAVTTREGLREVARAGFRNRTSIDIEPLEIRVFGDWAFARSRVTGSVTLRDSGEVVHIDMKQIVIYARDGNGRWRMARLIGNSNG